MKTMVLMLVPMAALADTELTVTDNATYTAALELPTKRIRAL